MIYEDTALRRIKESERMVDYKRLFEEKMKKDRARQKRWRDRKAAEGKRTLSVMIGKEIQEIINREVAETGDSKEAIVFRAFMAYRDSLSKLSEDATRSVKEDTGQKQMALGLKGEPEPPPADADHTILSLRAKRYTFKEIADWLNEAGILTVKGLPWKENNVRMRFAKLKGGA